MANDPSLAEYWPNADVYVAAVGSAIPADEDTPFDGDWSLIGCLDGEAGFAWSRARTKAQKFAWGEQLIRTTRKDFLLSCKFTAFEGGNEAVDNLVWPGSTGGTLIIPEPERILIAFETREGAAVKRMISAYEVEVEVDGDVVEKSDVTGYPFMATIFPNGDGELLIRQPAGPDAPTIASIAVTGTNSIGVGVITSLTATATYSDATTADVTSRAVWTSATPAKATVSTYGAGFVTGVGAGTSVITAAHGGVSGTRTVTVS